MPTQAGGSANIRGVVYQMLSSLLEASELIVENFTLDPPADGSIPGWLVVEPKGGGGDDQVFTRGRVLVRQLKAKSDGGAWSFRSFVEEVLPDLYRAAERYPDATFRLVTEGRMGLWRDAESFLTWFADHKPSASDPDVLELIDDAEPVAFVGDLPKVASKGGLPTARDLFVGIARTIREPVSANAEDRQPMYRDLWRLLGGLEYRWKQNLEDVRDLLKKRILAQVSLREDTDEKLYAMLGRLQDKAASGEVRIDALSFWRECGLRGLPLNRWDLVRAASEERVEKAIRSWKYRPEEDVRSDWFEGQLESWHDGTRRYLVLSGESGQGKSWYLAALARRTARDVPCVSIQAPATGGFAVYAAERFLVEEVIRRSQSVSLANLAQQAKDLGVSLGDPWLYVFVDRVRTADQAQSVYDAFEGIDGVRVALAAPVEAGEEANDATDGRALVVRVPNFTEAQAKRYLVEDDFIRWQRLDPSVRSTVERPLLAYLFKKTGAENPHPEQEFELYCSYFEKEVLSPLRRDFPLAEGPIAAAGWLAWERYLDLWSHEQLSSCGFRDEHLVALRNLGWFVREEPHGFRVWHDRLLSWLMAWSIATRLTRGEKAVEDIAPGIRWLLDDEWTRERQTRLDVPFDLIWLLASGGERGRRILSELLAKFEDDWRLSSTLYERDLVQVGEGIVPVLIERLSLTRDDGGRTLARSLGLGIAAVGTAGKEAELTALLDHPDDEVRTAVARVFQARPTALALPKLWERYGIAVREHEYAEGEEGDASRDWWWESLALRSAVYQCGPLDGDWVERTIADPRTSGEPLDCLAGLLSRLRDGEPRWRRLKATLRRRLEGNDLVQFTANTFAWRDEDEEDWLAEEVRSGVSFRAALALRSLARISLDRALALMGEIPPFEFYGSRRWALEPLLAIAPNETLRKVEAMIASKGGERWDYSQAFHEVANQMPVSAFASLLDALVPSAEQAGPDGLWHQCKELSRAKSLAHLHELWLRGGTALEKALADALTKRGRLPTMYADASTAAVGSILRNVGGDGYTKVLNFWLSSDDERAQLEGVMKAHRRPDAETVRSLMRVYKNWSSQEKSRWPASWVGLSLARCGAWQEAVETVIGLAGKSDQRTINSRRHVGPLDDEAMLPAFDALNTDPLHPGALLALGMGQRTDRVDALLRAISITSGEGEAADSAILALRAFKELPEEAFDAVIGRARGLESRWELGTLADNPSRKSLDRLLELLREELAKPVAFPVNSGHYGPVVWALRTTLKSPDHSDEAARLCLARINAGSKMDYLAEKLVDAFASALASDQASRTAFDSPRVRERFERESTVQRLRGGADLYQTNSVIGLSAFDPDGAFWAARTILADVSPQERVAAATLLVGLSEKRAEGALIDALSQERVPSVRHAIARALALTGAESALIQLLSDPNEERRKAACFALGFRDPDPAVIEAVRGRLDDPLSEVFDVAVEATHRLRRAASLGELIEAFETEADQARRRILLDAAVDVGEVDGERGDFPAWAKRLGKSLSSLEAEEVDRRLEARMRKEQTRLDKLDRDAKGF